MGLTKYKIRAEDERTFKLYNSKSLHLVITITLTPILLLLALGKGDIW